MREIDLEALVFFLRALRANSYTSTDSDGWSKNRIDSTVVSFDSEDRFICYTTEDSGVFYSFYDDLVLYRENIPTDRPEDFQLVNGRLEREGRELELGLSFQTGE